jgi:hypothetical protein
MLTTLACYKLVAIHVPGITNSVAMAMNKRKKNIWKGPIPDGVAQIKPRKFMSDLARYWENRAQEVNQKGDLSFSLKANAKATILGIGCLLTAYALNYAKQVIDIQDKFNWNILIAFSIAFGLILLGGSLINAFRYWLKSKGKLQSSSIENPERHPIIIIVAFLLLGVGGIAVALFFDGG